MTEALKHGGPESREATSFLSKQTWLMGICAPAHHWETQVSTEHPLEGTPSSAVTSKAGPWGEHGRFTLSTLQPLARGTAREASCLQYHEGTESGCRDNRQASAHAWTP